MRNLCLAALFVVLAALWLTACCKNDPVCSAAKTLDTITLAARDAEAGYKAMTHDRLQTIAKEQAALRTEALKQEGCSLAASQPADAPAVCQKIAADHRAAYEARKGKLVAIVTKLDAGSATLRAALLVAVDVLILVRDGMKHKLPELSALVAEVVKVGQAFLDAYQDFKKAGAF